MAVQDDRREVEVRDLVGLRAGETRSGVDAWFDFSDGNRSHAVPVELKSTTNRTVSTARDVGPAHIRKWRSRLWVFGFYDSSGAVMEGLLILGPDDMESWIVRVEQYIAPDFLIGERAAERLTLEDLHIVCGEKPAYSQRDARALHKRQWPEARYESEMDVTDGYSPGKMLEILRLRAKYLNARGATLNNPHIPKRFFAAFRDFEMDARKAAVELRRAARRRMRSIVLGTPALRRNAPAVQRPVVKRRVAPRPVAHPPDKT